MDVEPSISIWPLHEKNMRPWWRDMEAFVAIDAIECIVAAATTMGVATTTKSKRRGMGSLHL